LKKSKIKEIKIFKKSKIEEVEVLETQPESATQVESRGLLTWVYPSGTHRLVYRVRPIMKVDKYKDSKIDLETKKESSNTYLTRILVNSSLVAYIKPGRGAPRGIHNILQIIDFRLDNRIDTKLCLRRHPVNTIVIIY
jgi:hypothetical protein